MSINWIKSSYSVGGNCLKWIKSTYSDNTSCLKWSKSSQCANGADCLKWHKSSRSITGDCVKVSEDASVVHIGDTKLESATDPDGPYLTFSLDAWNSFVAGVRMGEFG